MKKQTVVAVVLMIASFLLITNVPCRAAQSSWACVNDDEAKGVYRVCNYFPLDPNNQWQYTTGNYFISEDTRKCASGYSGILFETTTFEYSPYMQNESRGLLFAGCQYNDENVLEDLRARISFVPPQMQVGQTVITSVTHYKNGKKRKSTFEVTLVGLETIEVPAGTFTTLRTEMWIHDITAGSSYKTTLWLAKGIGPVRIHRTDANPADYGGCVFVCNPEDDLTKLNTPAELVSYHIDSSQGPDLTGTWTSLSQSCRNFAKGVRCTINGKLNIQNIGTKNAASSKVKFYLSDDNTFDDTDTYLKQVSISSIKAGGSSNKSLNYTFLYGETLTDKYIVAVIDADNTVFEVDENNNEIGYGPMQ